MKNILADKKGLSYVYVAVIILIMAMMFFLVLSYASIITLISNVKSDTQRVLDNFCVEKSNEIYDSILNGNNQTAINTYTAEYMTMLSEELNLNNIDNSVNTWYNNYKDKDKYFFKFENPLTVNYEDNLLSLKFQYEVILPVKFMGGEITEVRIPVTVKSFYVLNQGGT